MSYATDEPGCWYFAGDGTNGIPCEHCERLTEYAERQADARIHAELEVERLRAALQEVREVARVINVNPDMPAGSFADPLFEIAAAAGGTGGEANG